MNFKYTIDGDIYYDIYFTKILLKKYNHTDEVFIKIKNYIIQISFYAPQFYLTKNEEGDIEKYFGSFKCLELGLSVIKYPWDRYFITKDYK